MKEGKRILLALDASAHSRRALETAVALAARERAELIGFFVEDINLFRMAELASVRELQFPAAVEARIDRERLARELRVRALELCGLLAEAAERAQIAWSFQIVRGQPARELATAAAAVDALLLASRELLARETAIRQALEERCCAARLLPAGLDHRFGHGVA